VQLTDQIDAALAEEREEVEEVIAAAEAFRTRNERMAYALLLTALGVLVTSFVSFNAQLRKPLMRLRDSLSRLRTADYSGSVDLGGAAEFRELGQVLGDMAAGLSQREAGREEQRQQLEETVARRTAELQRMIGRLEKGDENRKRLMADISHELRTPLTIILGEAEVALRTSRGIENDVSDALARIRDSARHTNQIVDDMLTVARQEAGQLRLDRRERDLRKVLHDAVEMFPQAVELDMPVEPLLVSVDAVRMRQSILALLQNARRYGGPRILACLAAEAGSVVLTVEDDGPGLSDAEKRDAFERFFRGSNASGQGIEGSGLGLPVVKSIVEAHGGQVTLADSELGGLLVRIELPRTAPLRIVGPEPAARSA
jgi:signal transduction histidine kinase